MQLLDKMEIVFFAREYRIDIVSSFCHCQDRCTCDLGLPQDMNLTVMPIISTSSAFNHLVAYC